jgi:hypothetical protein
MSRFQPSTTIRRTSHHHSTGGPISQERPVTQQSTPSPHRRLSRWTRPFVVRGLTLIAGLVAALGLWASAAQADVNTTTNGYGWATLSNCTIYAGDQWSPYNYAIGDTTVRCGSHHNLAVYTVLYYNGAPIATSNPPYTYYANATYVHDVPTTPVTCVATGSWFTRSYISIDGGSWHYKDGPVESWAPACP